MSPMPSIPPMPPLGIAGAALFSGFSATIASVVISSDPTEAAPCKGRRSRDCRRSSPTACRRRSSRPRRHSRRSGGPRRRAPADDVDANLLVAVFGLQRSERLGAMEEGDAAAGDDAFLDRGAGRVHGVLDPVLALLHFGFRGAAYPDDGDTAGQLRQPLLQLLAVVVGGVLLDLRPDLRDAALDLLLLAGAVDDRRVVLVDADPLGPAKHVEGDGLELDAEVFAH